MVNLIGIGIIIFAGIGSAYADTGISVPPHEYVISNQSGNQDDDVTVVIDPIADLRQFLNNEQTSRGLPSFGDTDSFDERLSHAQMYYQTLMDEVFYDEVLEGNLREFLGRIFNGMNRDAHFTPERKGIMTRLYTATLAALAAGVKDGEELKLILLRVGLDDTDLILKRFGMWPFDPQSPNHINSFWNTWRGSPTGKPLDRKKDPQIYKHLSSMIVRRTDTVIDRLSSFLNMSRPKFSNFLLTTIDWKRVAPQLSDEQRQMVVQGLVYDSPTDGAALAKAASRAKINSTLGQAILNDAIFWLNIELQTENPTQDQGLRDYCKKYLEDLSKNLTEQ